MTAKQRLQPCVTAIPQQFVLNSKLKLTPLAMACLLAGAGSLSTLVTHNAYAQGVSAQQNVSISAGKLSDVLAQFAARTGVPLSFDPKMLVGKQSTGLQGSFSIREGFNVILKGSGFELIEKGNGTYSLRKATQDVTALEVLEVTGKEFRFGDVPEFDGFKAEYQATATKTPLSLRETPQAISVVTRDSLEVRQVNDLSTALELTAGVSSSGSGVGTSVGPGMFAGSGQYIQKFSLRGRPAAVVTDGFTSGSSDGADMAAYEGVETVKGPSGFYGSGSLGGFINLVRKKPKEEFDARISAQAGSFDTYRGELDVTGSLSANNNILGRAVVAYEDSGSFVEDINSKKIMVAPSLEAKIGDKTRILLQSLYQKKEYDVNPGVSLALEDDRLTTVEGWDSRTTLYGRTADEPSTRELKELSLTANHELSDDWMASVLMHGAQNNTDIVNYGVGVMPNIALMINGRDAFTTDTWSAELRLDGTFEVFDQEHQILFGYSHTERDTYRDFGGGLSPIGPPAMISPEILPTLSLTPKSEMATTIAWDQDLTSKAFYSQLILNLTDKTKLLTALRYTDVKQFTAHAGNITNKSGDALTTRLGLTQSFNENLSAYATYAESFEPVSAVGRDGLLDPETGKGYELGIKSDWFDSKLNATLAMYRQDLDNIPLNDPGSTVDEPYSISSGLHRTEGVELEISGSPFSGLTIGAAANWMDNEFIEDTDPNKGTPLDGSVDEQYSLFAEYQINSGTLQGLGVGATIVKVGDRQFNSPTPDEQGEYKGKTVYLDGYERMDINLSYRGVPNWDFLLLVRNVTDEKYIESAASQYQFGSFYGSPRAVLLKASYNFN